MPKKFSFDKEKALENFSRGFEQFTYRNKIKPIEVAKDFGLTHAAVSSWKNGKGFPDFQTLYKLFCMGMTIREVFGNDFGLFILNSERKEIVKTFLDEIIERKELELRFKIEESAEALAKVNFIKSQKEGATDRERECIEAMTKESIAKNEMTKINSEIALLNSLKNSL